MVDRLRRFCRRSGSVDTFPIQTATSVIYRLKTLPDTERGSIRNEDDEFRFYTFPHVFEGEIAQGFNPSHFARALSAAGMLEAGGDRRYKKKALGRIGGKQHIFYVLMFQPEAED